jgi:hypothetical protein
MSGVDEYYNNERRKRQRAEDEYVLQEEARKARIKAAEQHALIRPQLIEKFSRKIRQAISDNIQQRFKTPSIRDVQFDEFFDDDAVPVEDVSMLSEIADKVRRDDGVPWTIYHGFGRMIICVVNIPDINENQTLFGLTA